MAQLINYHQHPKQPIGRKRFFVGVNDDTVYGTEEVYTRGGDGLGGQYSWPDMVADPNCRPSLRQRRAVGALCYDVGLSINMNYTPTGSFPKDGLKVKDALMNTFKYANAVTAYSGGSNIGPGLITMTNANLDAYNPVIFYTGGQDEHGVVCDGYGYNGSTLYHHLNMGWYGIDDAWYNLPDARCSMEFTSITTCFYNIFTTYTGEIISGRVTDNTGNPLEDAVVTAEIIGGGTYADKTDAYGIYALAGVPSDSTSILTVTKPGHSFSQRVVSTSRSVDMSAFSGNRWAVDFPYTPLPFDIIYVDQKAFSGAKNGLSWANAFTDLQDALTMSANLVGAVKEIWVADGTYRPDRGTGLRTLSFQLIDGVALYGGFAGLDSINYPGGETQRQQRDPKKNVTILSGDLNADDGGGFANNDENSYHVVNGSGTGPTTIIDGSTIVAGNANSSVPRDTSGGGMYIFEASPTVSNCTFSGNWALCGGGIAIDSNSYPSMRDCLFVGNKASTNGGAINSRASRPELSNCQFRDNSADFGGGLFNDSNSSPKLTNCNFIENNAVYDGGGIYNWSECRPELKTCLFRANKADNNGGGMYNDATSCPIVSDCNFVENLAVEYGGGDLRL